MPTASPARPPRARPAARAEAAVRAPVASHAEPPHAIAPSVPARPGLRLSECATLVLAGVAFPFAFAPVAWVPLALAAPGVLGAVVGRLTRRGASAGTSAWAGGLTGTAAGLSAVPWVVPTLADYGTATAVAAWVALSVFWGAFFALGAVMMHALLSVGRAPAGCVPHVPRVPLALAVAIGWTAQETLHAHAGDLGVPWLPAGLPLAAWPTLAQAAELGGVRLLSFAVALAAGLLAAAWGARARPAAALRRAAGAAGVFALLGAYGAWRERALAPRLTAAPRARLVVVQPNVSRAESRRPGRERAWVGRAVAGTRRWAAARPAGAPATDLVVWPESALPGLLPDFPDWRDSLRAAARAAGAPVLAGGVDLEVRPGGRFGLYNAAWLTDAAGELPAAASPNVSPNTPAGGVYRKRVLVPLVETTPYVGLVPFLDADALGYARGASSAPLAAARPGRPPLPVGVVVCYESAFPELARAARAAGAAVVVVLTNDAWFGRTAAPAQHFAHLAMRAVETRAAVVQAANTGPSGWADPLGRVRARTSLGAAGAFAYDVPLLAERTPYVRLGDWPGLGSAAAGLLALGAGAARRLRRRGRAA